MEERELRKHLKVYKYLMGVCVRSRSKEVVLLSVATSVKARGNERAQTEKQEPLYIREVSYTGSDSPSWEILKTQLDKVLSKCL